ncbi:hypothetical protein GIB67_032219 [Kingdonia uniflora]|uniref:Uncharacterized protein n=1 Tax=Kingdonia uniflora TaxID=39325 RepID=A0A7J7MXM1_9MAGN|nr:hypothetical protein GIB67_032219 [Kingdonia uniflora]
MIFIQGMFLPFTVSREYERDVKAPGQHSLGWHISFIKSLAEFSRISIVVTNQLRSEDCDEAVEYSVKGTGETIDFALVIWEFMTRAIYIKDWDVDLPFATLIRWICEHHGISVPSHHLQAPIGPVITEETFQAYLDAIDECDDGALDALVNFPLVEGGTSLPHMGTSYAELPSSYTPRMHCSSLVCALQFLSTKMDTSLKELVTGLYGDDQDNNEEREEKTEDGDDDDDDETDEDIDSDDDDDDTHDDDDGTGGGGSV